MNDGPMYREMEKGIHTTEPRGQSRSACHWVLDRQAVDTAKPRGSTLGWDEAAGMLLVLSFCRAALLDFLSMRDSRVLRSPFGPQNWRPLHHEFPPSGSWGLR